MDSNYEIVKELIDFNCEGVDTYNHNGSTWLIFTDNKKWVIELTKEKTLWYNYYFFKGAFKYLSLDVLENQHYITKWVEDTVINGVKHTQGCKNAFEIWVEDTVINGVKHTSNRRLVGNKEIEDTIQNGVKYTWYKLESIHNLIEDTIQNGVKYTMSNPTKRTYPVEGTIQNGIKEIKKGEINQHFEMFGVIENGVKKTTPGGYLGSVEMMGKTVHQFEHAKQNEDVEDVIDNGVKHTEISWSNFDRVDDVLEKGINETKGAKDNLICSYTFQHQEDIRKRKIEEVIISGIKETHDDAYHHTGRVEGVIKNGVKEPVPVYHLLCDPIDFSTKRFENHRLKDVTNVLEKGIKDVQPLPSQEGNMDWGDYYHKQEDRTKPHTKYVDDVITNGIKQTKAMDEWVNTDRIVDGVISGGFKKLPI